MPTSDVESTDNEEEVEKEVINPEQTLSMEEIMEEIILTYATCLSDHTWFQRLQTSMERNTSISLMVRRVILVLIKMHFQRFNNRKLMKNSKDGSLDYIRLCKKAADATCQTSLTLPLMKELRILLQDFNRTSSNSDEPSVSSPYMGLTSTSSTTAHIPTQFVDASPSTTGTGGIKRSRPLALNIFENTATNSEEPTFPTFFSISQMNLTDGKSTFYKSEDVWKDKKLSLRLYSTDFLAREKISQNVEWKYAEYQVTLNYNQDAPNGQIIQQAVDTILQEGAKLARSYKEEGRDEPRKKQKSSW